MKRDTLQATENFGEVGFHQLRCDSGRKIEWVAEDGSVRIPEEKKTEFPYPGRFTAAGKTYRSWKELCTEPDESGLLCKDIYGRQVLYLSELFPCFDSYDYLNENRYYRWFFIKENGKLTRVYCADQRGVIQVTEDVRNLEYRCCEQMQKLNWI